MIAISNLSALSLAILGSMLIQPSPAPAQATASPHAVMETARHNSRGTPAAPLVRQPQVDAALRNFGFRPERLTRQQERALGQTASTLFPQTDWRRHRLNGTQATALVYMALVHSSGGPGARPLPRRAECEAMARRVHELEDHYAAPARGQSMYLRREEQERLTAAAREVQRLARSCNDFDMADEAGRLAAMTADSWSGREQVDQQVRRMKAMARSHLDR